jgi:hypothetical protein
MRNFDVEARIANPPESLLAKHTKKEKEFFYDYAAFVQRLLNSGQIKDRLRGLIEKESIDPGRAIDLRVMVFPAQPMTGRPRSILHGSFNQDTSQISLYPLKLPRDWVRREGYGMFKAAVRDLSPAQRKALREVLMSAITTLIHEILHVKFENRQYSRYAEEAIVRKLERKYAEEWFASLSLDYPSLLASQPMNG